MVKEAFQLRIVPLSKQTSHRYFKIYPVLELKMKSSTIVLLSMLSHGMALPTPQATEGEIEENNPLTAAKLTI